MQPSENSVKNITVFSYGSFYCILCTRAADGIRGQCAFGVMEQSLLKEETERGREKYGTESCGKPETRRGIQ